jgi:hypothetical protein
MTRYTISSTQEFIDHMISKGWDAVQLNEGNLGLGDWVLIAPDEKYWNFVIREVPLGSWMDSVGSWASAQTIRRCRKLSQRILKEMEEIEA